MDEKSTPEGKRLIDNMKWLINNHGKLDQFKISKILGSKIVGKVKKKGLTPTVSPDEWLRLMRKKDDEKNNPADGR